MGIEFTEREKKIIVHGLQLFMSHAAQYEGVVTEPERKELFRGGHEDAKALIQKVTAGVEVAAPKPSIGAASGPINETQVAAPVGVKTTDPFIEHFAKEEAAQPHSYDAGGVQPSCELGCTATENCKAIRDGCGSECIARPFQLRTDGVGAYAPVHKTEPGESLAGMAIRQLGDEKRWTEIRDLNADRFPDMGPNDYYPVGTVLRMPLKGSAGVNSDGGQEE
jgi:hypothetical protein